MRIGILGGTFDPPHVGHLELARCALEQLQLDEVLFVPTYETPDKGYKHPASAKHRFKMVELCLEGEPRMSVSNIEVTRGGISYSVDTLAEFHAAQPADYWFLMGSDALLTLMTWKHPEKLMKLCRLGVALRAPEHKVLCSKNLPEWVLEKIDWVERPFSAISSTSVRDKIFRDQDVSQWLKPEVLQYIQEKKLYRK